MRLNPFEFRAGIYLLQLSRAHLYALVLIPLNSGLVFTCEVLLQPPQLLRLNPFEFRAGIYLRTPDRDYHKYLGLNPFEFRAGIYL